MVAHQWAFALADADDRDGGQVVERNGQHRQRHKQAVPAAGVVGSEIGRSDSQKRQHKTDHQRAAVTHEDACGRKVEGQEPQDRTNQQSEGGCDEPLLPQQGGSEEADAGDERHAACEAVHVVEKVHRVGDEHDPADGDECGKPWPASRRIEHGQQAGVGDQRHGCGTTDHDDQFDPRAQRSAIVNHAQQMEYGQAGKQGQCSWRLLGNARQVYHQLWKAAGDGVCCAQFDKQQPRRQRQDEPGKNGNATGVGNGAKVGLFMPFGTGRVIGAQAMPENHQQPGKWQRNGQRNGNECKNKPDHGCQECMEVGMRVRVVPFEDGLPAGSPYDQPMHPPADHVFHHTPDTLKAWFEMRGLPGFRATQVLDWVYRKGVIDPDQMSNLPRRDRQLLAREMVFDSGQTLAHQRASDGTQKLLIEWNDACNTTEKPDDGPNGSARDGTGDIGLPLIDDTPHPERQTECVMIPVEQEGKARRTACISSQVGCPVGCSFCASGLGGLDGNLSAGRIVEQVWKLNRMLADEAESAFFGSGVPRITNIVFMGMGEPLANFGHVIQAVRTLAADWGVHISARKITISTVGMPAAIDRLARELELPVTLALSLHAPNDGLRRELIPWARYSTIAQLVQACQGWYKKTGREITLEYILLGGVNDSPEHAVELSRIARSIRANVNLIRYNEVASLDFVRPDNDAVREFARILRARKVNTHIRASRGRDIAAACGQLRHQVNA